MRNAIGMKIKSFDEPEWIWFRLSGEWWEEKSRDVGTPEVNLILKEERAREDDNSGGRWEKQSETFFLKIRIFWIYKDII